jgi:signal peptidase II
LRKIFITAFILVLIDQILKIWIKTHFILGEEFQIFDWFIIHFTENPGMAFGWELPLQYGKPVLTLLRIIVVVAGIFYVKSIAKALIPKGALIALGLIIGGAIGNIIDSTFYGLIFNTSYYGGNLAEIFPEAGNYAPLFYGNVVDMFRFPLFTINLPNWLAIPMPFTQTTILSLLEGHDGKFSFFNPIFNVADAGISVGIFMILLFYRRVFS